MFSPAGEDALSQQVAIDAEGNAPLAWSRSDGFNDRIQTGAALIGQP